MELTLVTASTTTPVTLAQAKAHLYVTSTDWDADITSKLASAVDYCERAIPGGKKFMSATYDMTLPEFPYADEQIKIPLPPLNKVKHIKYYDADGVLQTYGSTLGSTASSTSWVQVKSSDYPGYVVPAFSRVWPTTRVRPDAVTIRFVAGSTAAASVPASAKHAVLLTLGDLWENRGDVPEQKTKNAVNRLLGVNHYGHYS